MTGRVQLSSADQTPTHASSSVIKDEMELENPLFLQIVLSLSTSSLAKKDGEIVQSSKGIPRCKVVLHEYASRLTAQKQKSRGCLISFILFYCVVGHPHIR